MTISYVNPFINLEIDERKPWKIEPQVLEHPVNEKLYFVSQWHRLTFSSIKGNDSQNGLISTSVEKIKCW